MKIWDLSIRQPVLIVMLMFSLLVLGVYSYLRMPVNLFPEVSFPVLAVTTVYPGATPEEVADQVTELLEEELNSLAGVDTVTSTSSESFSLVVLQFTLETDIDRAAQAVLERVNLVRNRLPGDAENPMVQRFDPTDDPILVFSVADRSGQASSLELRALAEDAIQRPLRRIPGVASVEVAGGRVREIQINLDRLALQARRIAPQQVVAALRSENLNIPGGQVPAGTGSGVEEVPGSEESARNLAPPDPDTNWLLRTPGTFQDLADIEAVVITQRSAPVFLRDVAQIVDGLAKQESITRLNGQEAVVVNVRKQSGTNTLVVANQVKQSLDSIRSTLPNLDIVVASDQSVFVQESTDDAIVDTLWGALLATLVVLFFFRNLRNTFITMVGLPVIMIGTLAGMDLLGITLNLVTLLAMAIVVGLVIDDAIVVRENIFRWTNMGYPPRVAASRATAEVFLAVLATSATILAVFLPVAYASGIVGQFIRDFGLTVAIAITISTVEAITLAPMLSAYLFAGDAASSASTANGQMAIDPNKGLEQAGTGWLYRLYGGLLNWTLDHKPLAILISIAVVAVSLLSFPFLDRTFLAPIDQGEFAVGIELPPGTRLEVTAEQAIQVEGILSRHPRVANVFTTIGAQGAPEQASFFVVLVDDAADESRAVIDALRQQLDGVPGLAFRLTGGPFDFGDDSFGGRDIILSVSSNTDDLPALAAASEHVIEQLSRIPGLTDIQSSHKPGKPEVRLSVDRQRAAQFGLSTAQVGSTIRTLVNGEIASTYRGQGREADIRVQLREVDRANIEEILDLQLLSPDGQLVPLRNVVQAELASGPTSIRREDRQPRVTIGANYAGRGEGEVMADVRATLDSLQLPPGVSAALVGEAAEQEKAFQDLFQVLLLSIVFVYIVLASQFGSFTQPFLIMLAMPLSIIGAILALAFTARPLDMTAMIGFIMLMGLATKNSILLVDFANQEHRQGASADLAMRRAGPVRLRPILMTAVSLILGMMPVALGLGPGGSFRAPMATGIIGGMVTSTALTLFVVPLAYSIWVTREDRIRAWWAARQGDELDPTRGEIAHGVESLPEAGPTPEPVIRDGKVEIEIEPRMDTD